MTNDDENWNHAKKAFERARRMRNIAIGVILAFLCALFYLMTIVRIGGNVAQ